MKKVKTAEDVPYVLSLGPSTFDEKEWSRAVIVQAKVVGTDGVARDEDVLSELGQLKVTSRAVRIRWSYAYLSRAQETLSIEKKRDMYRGMKEIPLPRPLANARSSFSALRRIADRLNFIVCPQHNLFGIREAKGLCEFVHNYLVVHRVMTD